MRTLFARASEWAAPIHIHIDTNRSIYLYLHTDTDRHRQAPPSYITIWWCLFTPKRHLPTPGQHGHSPQRHTAAGTAAPSTADMGNAVHLNMRPQSASASECTAPIHIHIDRNRSIYLCIDRHRQAYPTCIIIYLHMRPQSASASECTAPAEALNTCNTCTPSG